ncbi:SCP2 sterol-binding domain-containing protein [Chloroflexota bacterium]
MPFFADSEQFYTCARTLFARMEEDDPGAANDVLASRLIVRLHCTQPDVEITINGRQRPLQNTFGPSRVRPTLDIKMTTDTLHHILLGEQSLKKALANGLLKVHGPVWKALELADLFHRLQAIYPQVLREQGLVPDQ